MRAPLKVSELREPGMKKCSWPVVQLLVFAYKQVPNEEENPAKELVYEEQYCLVFP